MSAINAKLIFMLRSPHTYTSMNIFNYLKHTEYTWIDQNNCIIISKNSDKYWYSIMKYFIIYFREK